MEAIEGLIGLQGDRAQEKIMENFHFNFFGQKEKIWLQKSLARFGQQGKNRHEFQMTNQMAASQRLKLGLKPEPEDAVGVEVAAGNGDGDGDI